MVSVKVSDKASGSMINCEEVDVSSTLLPPPNATGANVIVAGDSWGSFGAKPSRTCSRNMEQRMNRV